jgi:hypothetical protein
MLATVSNQKENEMERISETTPTKYTQVTVDVPEERLAQFHAFFARFLAGRDREGRRGERRHHGRGHSCRYGHGRSERSAYETTPAETTGQAPEITEV